MRYFFHQGDLRAARVVPGIEDADSRTVRQRLGVDAARPPAFAMDEKLLAKRFGQLLASIVQIDEAQTDKRRKLKGIKQLLRRKVELFAQCNAVRLPYLGSL